MEPALLAAYRATRVEVTLPSGVVVLSAADEAPLTLPAALQPSAWILTAWNPWSQPLSLEENQRRNEALQVALQELAVRVYPAVGRAREGDWWEASFAVVGLDEASALSLGRRFGQNAVFQVTEGGLVVRPCAS